MGDDGILLPGSGRFSRAALALWAAPGPAASETEVTRRLVLHTLSCEGSPSSATATPEELTGSFSLRQR